MEENTCYIIGIDRGIISDRKADGGGKYLYRVESETRNGIQSRWIESVNAYINEYRGEPPTTYKRSFDVGDMVYYFMFPDGRGMIIGIARTDI